MYPLHFPSLPICNLAYMKSLYNTSKCIQEAEYALNLLNNFNIKVISGHNKYFKVRLNSIDPSIGRELYSSVAKYYLSTRQIFKFNEFIIIESTRLKTLKTTLESIHNLLITIISSVDNNLFFLRTETILEYSRSLTYTTEAINNLKLFDRDFLDSLYTKKLTKNNHLYEVLNISDQAHYNDFIKRYRNTLFNLRKDINNGRILIDPKINVNPFDKPSTNSWNILNTSWMYIVCFGIVYYAAGNWGY